MSWLSKLKISNKLLVYTLFVLVFLIIMGGVNGYFLSQITRGTEEMYNDRLLPVQWMGEVRTLSRDTEAKMWEIIISRDPERQKELAQGIEKNTAKVNELQDKYKQTKLDNEEVQKLTELEPAQDYTRSVRKMVIQLGMEGRTEEAIAVFRGNQVVFTKVIDLREDIAEYNRIVAERLHNDVEKLAVQTNITVIITTALLMIVCYLIGSLITRSLTAPIDELQLCMTRVGAADLTAYGNVRSTDEVGQMTATFNQMVSNQTETVGMIRSAAENLAASSQELAASSQEVSASIQDVAHSIQSISDETDRGNNAIVDASTVLVELSSLIQIARAQAQKAADNSRLMTEAAATGRQTVNETIGRMSKIKEKTLETESLMSTLEQYSQQIRMISDTITAIAEQTNLLALNASIEAARAGEAGRGFAVVADEVRKLAEQSNRGAWEVSQLIEKITESTLAAVAATLQSREEVDAGVTVVQQAGQALENIGEAVQHTEEAVDNIVTVTTENVASSDKIVKLIDSVATVIENVNRHVHQVAAAVEETTASMETIAAGSEETSAVASELLHSVQRFRLETDSKLSPVQILTKAKSDHLLWKLRIENMLKGVIQIQPEEVNTHQECRLGRWYFGDNAFADDPDFIAIDGPHHKVHECASKAVVAFHAGNRPEAERQYKELERNSEQVLRLLDRLIEKVDR
ncbi:HAMP domain-containing protein [Heliobacterium gestii]|uniref:HAMP domain-containing protein n=1 Tax=Heliomicrobium gestii TaxID=2699 RepID=A0A845LAM3_HELGE|nr:methyl-accepting chemotaxis protein [Heliomicrobium gestii]MBM7866049.1 methyl-accepting chemotaxis protein [Heliomicrobium gestii]MZP42621.1 HAMP domain-containing protein [Heliomicrobium gestii]